MEFIKRIQENTKQQKYSRITRKVSKKNKEISTGYIIKHSKNFLLLQDIENFNTKGFDIIQISKITEIRYNNYDAFYDKIFELEGEKKNLGFEKEIELLNWETIFKSLQNIFSAIIIECESPKHDSFTIGPIVKVTSKSVFIRYFNPEGILEKVLTKIKFKHITKITLGDRYTELFSKYLRYEEEKK